MARTKGASVPKNVTTAKMLANLPVAGSSIDSKSLPQKAMLVNLSISQWGNRKNDKAAALKVSEDFNSEESAGRFHKLLIAKEALKKINSAVSSARAFHYSNTLPWNDNGDRILPALNYIEYTTELRKLKNDFNNAIDELIQNYPTLIEEAKVMLGTLYNSDDYPQVNKIRSKFDFVTDFYPLPVAEDFRVMLADEEITQLQSALTDRAEVRFQSAMRDLYQRLFEVVSKAADKLKDPKATFHDTLIGNIVEITELLPKLNITNDPALEELRKIVEDKLCQKEPTELRTDINARKEVAADAQAILDAMSAYM